MGVAKKPPFVRLLDVGSRLIELLLSYWWGASPLICRVLVTKAISSMRVNCKLGFEIVLTMEKI